MYSIRSYFKAGDSDAGVTQWTADYWAGSTGIYVPGYTGHAEARHASPLYPDYLQVAVDDAGDVYVSGPRATASDGGSHWNLIKYDGATGEEIYKVDVNTGGKTGNLWSILYFPFDGNLYVLGDVGDTGGLGPNLATVVKVDPSTGALVGPYLTLDGPSLKLGLNDRGVIPVVVVFGNSFPVAGGANGNPRYQTIVNGKLLNLSQASDPTDAGPQLSVSQLPDDSINPLYRGYRIQGFTTFPFSAVRAADMIVGGTDFLIAASAANIHASDTPPDTAGLILLDTGLDGTAAGIFGPITYPFTYRWKKSVADVKSFLKFQDAAYLAMYGAPPTSTMVLLTLDGSKVFAHLHQQVTDIAFAAHSMVTVGFRKKKIGDLDFT